MLLIQKGEHQGLARCSGFFERKTCKICLGVQNVVCQIGVDSIYQWCHDTRPLINPDKAQTVCSTLDNKPAGKPMPAVTFDGVLVRWTNYLRYHDRMLTYRKQVQEKYVSPEGNGCKGYWTPPPLPTVSKCGAQCHWLWTWPHNNGMGKSAKAGQSAEWGNACQYWEPPGTHPLRTSGSC